MATVSALPTAHGFDDKKYDGASNPIADSSAFATPSKILDNDVPVSEITTTEPHSRWFQAAFHMCTVIAGAGVLGLPHAFAQLTWAGGVFTLIAVLIVSYYTTVLLARMHVTRTDVENSAPRRLNTYYGVAEYTMGKKLAAYLVAPFQVVIIVGSAIAFLIIAGTMIDAIYLGHCQNCTHVRQMVWTTGVAGVELLLSFFPSLESISGVSLLAAMATLGCCTISVALCASLGQQPDVSYSMPSSDSVWNIVCSIFTGISTVVFACSVNVILPEIQATLRPTPSPTKEGVKAISLTWVFVIILYFASACTGYYAFGRAVNSNILISIQQASSSSVVSAAVTVAEAFIIFHVVITYQVLTLPLFEKMERAAARNIEAVAKRPRFFRFPIRCSFIIGTWFVACAIPFFGDIMGLFGALACMPLTFIFPAAMYLMYRGNDMGRVERFACHAVIVGGILAGVMGTISAIAAIIQDASTFQMFA